MQEFNEIPLIVSAGDLWEQATQAEFLTAIGDGSLPPDAFHRWLVQDYLFATGLAGFQAVVAAKTPRPSHKPVIAGLGAIDAELDWFERHLATRDLGLQAEAHPVCMRYVDFLVASAYVQPFEVSLTILFGVEVCYLVAWSRLEAAGPYAEFIERWSNDRFVDYVRSLRTLVDCHPHPDQQALFAQTLRHERDFWRMTWEG